LELTIVDVFVLLAYEIVKLFERPAADWFRRFSKGFANSSYYQNYFYIFSINPFFLLLLLLTNFGFWSIIAFVLEKSVERFCRYLPFSPAVLLKQTHALHASRMLRRQNEFGYR